MWTNETIVNADMSDLRHGAFGKNSFYFFVGPFRI